MKVVDILSAWYISFDPSESRKEIAEARAKVCDTCEWKKELDSALLSRIIPEDQTLNRFKCNKCGCPLAKKIFSTFTNSCPLKKWDK